LNRVLRFTLLGLAVVVVLPSAGASDVTRRSRWIVTDLGTLGGKQTYAEAVNNRADVVGRSQTARGEFHAFLWRDGKLTDLRTLGGKFSDAVAINDQGDVIGSSSIESGPLPSGRVPRVHAFRWRGGELRDLGTLYGKSLAVAVNSRGEIVGTFWTRDGRSHAFLFREGVMRDLGTFRGVQSAAVDINDAGQVIGKWRTADRNYRGFLWQKGRMTDLGTLGGQWTRPYAMNSRGQVIGQSETASGDRHGFVWERGQLRDLGTLGGDYTEPSDINDLGQVVGQSEDRSLDHRAFLWERGKMRELGGLLGSAFAITNGGVVVGKTRSTARDLVHYPMVLERTGGQVLPGRFEFAQLEGISESGHIVATVSYPGPSRGVIWVRRR
jgi:probable HAF family extracellular repeat protein